MRIVFHSQTVRTLPVSFAMHKMRKIPPVPHEIRLEILHKPQGLLKRGLLQNFHFATIPLFDIKLY